jgi:hypothetical protein
MNDNNTDKLIGALSSTQATLMDVNKKLGELNDEIKGASKSSEKVSSALNKLTRTGLWVAGTGVAVALGHLILELWKYIHT